MIELTGNLGTHDFRKVIVEGGSVQISPAILDQVRASFDFLSAFAENKVIYGVNTGFGPMAQYRIPEDRKTELQYNLIRSHCTGAGQMLSVQAVRAAMLARLNTLCLGRSGVHVSVVELLVKMLNGGVTPVVYAHGGVGASGDLVQLAHIALALIGEGDVIHKGERRPTQEVFAELGLKPIKVVLREGLALMNGTSVMTGIGMLNVFHARQLVHWMIKASSAINEIVEAYDDHLSQGLNESKRHAGQRLVAELMREHLVDSRLVRKREHHLYVPQGDLTIFTEKVQEYYSLRCVPQILGPVLDTLLSTEQILQEEVNSANDNPIVDPEQKQVWHGGNFHGDYVSLEMDKLRIAITKLSMLAERQLNYLLNPSLNQVLAPFVNLGELGVNFGMQGAQFTATSTTAENQALATPLSTHSIPCNNDNQDIVSMGTNSAMATQRVIDNSMEVLAIELMSIVQAIDQLQFRDKVSSATGRMYDEVRSVFAPVVQDRVLQPDIQAVKELVLRSPIPSLTANAA